MSRRDESRGTGVSPVREKIVFHSTGETPVPPEVSIVSFVEPLLNHGWTQIDTDCVLDPASPNRERRVSFCRSNPR